MMRTATSDRTPATTTSPQWIRETAPMAYSRLSFGQGDEERIRRVPVMAVALQPRRAKLGISP
jgi:hypothetical protein